MNQKVRFGGTPAEQTYLATLVQEGVKTATSSLSFFQEQGTAQPTKVNDRWTICDENGQQICQVVVKKVSYCAFGEITDDFARAEGDGSFANWHHIHYNYYRALLAKEGQDLTNETLLECVSFRKI